MRVIAASAALLLLLLANLAAPALSMASESEPKAVRQAPLAPFPASFAGLLPCADCPGIRYRIDFLKSGSYVQRATYLREGHDESFYELGRWSLSDSGRAVTLDSGHEQGLWAIHDRHSLKKLDAHGRPIASRLPYQLTRGHATDPLEPRGKFSGMFRYLADAARFRECRSGLEWPVAMSDDYRALERAYAAARPDPGAEILVWLEARIESRPKAEGPGNESVLVVEKFVRVSPGDSCDEQEHNTGLQDSRWRLTRLGGTAVPVDPHEPWMVLDSRQKRMSGSGGCNRISGEYQAGDGTLRFSHTISTMMACPSLEVETELLGALDATRRFRITGRILELMSASGSVVAKFEEANLK